MTQAKTTTGLLKVSQNQPIMPPMNSPLGNIIKRKLADLGRTQEWLAEECGVSKTAVSKWIKTGEISREKSVVCARVLGITVDELLGRSLVDTSAPSETTLERLDAEEKRLLELYRRATKDGKMMIYGAATVAPKASESGNSINGPQ